MCIMIIFWTWSWWAEKNNTFSYNSGCLAVIIRLLFNPSDGLWLWHRRKRFVTVVYFKMVPQRNNRVKVSAVLSAGNLESRCLEEKKIYYTPTARMEIWADVRKNETDINILQLLWVVNTGNKQTDPHPLTLLLPQYLKIIYF